MRFAAVAFAALSFATSALATITITGPSETFYWVQNASNVITWVFAQGDPNPISIVLTNPNDTFLNGGFSIAQFVDLSNKSFTVTNVTLKVDDGYVVNFVTPDNTSNIVASSQTFSVKAPGTALAPTASSSVTPTSAGASATATSPSNSSSSSSTAKPTGASKSGAVANVLGVQSVVSIVAACGIASLSALVL